MTRDNEKDLNFESGHSKSHLLNPFTRTGHPDDVVDLTPDTHLSRGTW